MRTVLWNSVEHILTASLIVKAEYGMCFESTCYMSWLCNFICDLRVFEYVDRPIMMYYDNSIIMSYFVVYTLDKAL